jgi:hypothetical protein
MKLKPFSAIFHPLHGLFSVCVGAKCFIQDMSDDGPLRDWQHLTLAPVAPRRFPTLFSLFTDEQKRIQ